MLFQPFFLFLHQMKQTLKNIIPQWFIIKSQRSVILYLCFVLVAALLWLIQVLDKNYTYTISVPTHYENKPLDKALQYQLPKTIEVNVSADGFTLGNYLMFNEKKTLNFDLSEIAQKEKTTLQVKDYGLLDSLLRKMTIVEIYPQTIEFVFQKISSKRVKIKNKLDLHFERQYQLARPLHLTPDSVTLYGAKQVLDTIKQVYTIQKTISEIANQSTHNIALQTIENVAFSDSVISLLIDAEQFTEKKYTVPITFINVPANVVVDLMQNSVVLTVFVGMSHVGTIVEADFKAVADYKKRNSQTGEIPVEIIAKPQSGTIIQQNPENVEIIVERD